MSTSTLKIKSAVSQSGGHSRLDLSRKTLTTAKIGQILPIFHQECIPGDHFVVDMHSFSRFQPMSVPSFINLKLRTITLFVPYHQLKDGIDAYFGNQKKFKGQNTVIPKFNLATFADFVSTDSFGVATEVASTETYSLRIVTNGTAKYYRYTAYGNFVNKSLNNMGYRIAGTIEKPAAGNYYLNALPLLAYAHAYNSYLSYSPNYNTSALSQFLERVKRSDSNDSMTSYDLDLIFKSILLTYEDSFYTNAWFDAFVVNENSGTAQLKQYVLNSFGDAGSVVIDSNEGSFSDVNEYDHINATQIRLLLKMDDYFRRNNYSGSKDIEQIYSRFGVKLDDYKVRYPYYLGETSESVQIGDVTSTADTADAAVGSYAGKAIVSSNNKFTFDSKDYGMLITFAWYAPDVLNYQGYDMECLRLDPFDFYTPELDNGMASEIPLCQVFDSSMDFNQGFGYAPLYSQYLYPKDVISGDFTRLAGYSAWHFGRTNVNNTPAQSDAVIYMPNTGTEFERIFNILDPEALDVDTIYMTCHSSVQAERPMKDFSSKTQLGQGSLSMGVNGSQVN